MIYITYRYWESATKYVDGHYVEGTTMFSNELDLRDFVDASGYTIIGIWDMRGEHDG